jgi:hypothetical protein
VSRSTAPEGVGRDIVVHGQDSGVVQGQQRECLWWNWRGEASPSGIEGSRKTRKWAPCLSQAALKRTPGARSPHSGDGGVIGTRDVRSLVFIHHR